jgi:hypothetical protein
MKKRVFNAIAVGLCITATSWAQVPSYVPTNGLVGWWPFNGNANDASGNGNNGTVNGATPTPDRFGNSNAAYSFNGTSNYIDFFSSNTWCQSNHSISFWFYATLSSNGQYILTKRSSCLGGTSEPSYFQVEIPNNASTFAAGWGGNGGGYFNSTSFSFNQWNHVVYVANGASASLYLNGALVSTTPYISNTNNIMLRAGNHSCQVPNDWFGGKFDDFGLWNRALTQQEITNLHNSQACTASITPAGPTSICSGQSVTLSANTGSNGTQPCTAAGLPSSLQSGLIGYWPFCGNANDASGNGNNGTVNGPTLTTDRFGNSNAAYNFSNNGSTPQNIQTPLVGPTGTSARSISLWFLQTQSNGPSGDWVLGGYGQNSPGRTFAPFILSDKAGIDISNSRISYSSNTLGTWRNLILVYDPSFGNTISAVKLYIDGVLLSTVFSSLNPSTIINTGTGINFFIGSAAISQQFIGKIDDVALWNRVLTTQEIQQLYSLSNTQYAWSNGATTPSITVSPAQTTTYTVTITQNGQTCTASSTVNINNPTASISANGPTNFCLGGNVTLTASAGSSYLWSNGATSQSISVSQAGNYSVTVTDANGCNASANQTVSVIPLPNVSISPLPSFVNINAPALTITGSPSGGVFSGAGVSNNQFTPSVAGLGTTQVTYTFTNASNCSNSASTSTIVYDTTGVVCTSYDTTYISVTDTLIINTGIAGLNPPNNQNTILVFPNPTNDYITINYGNFALMAGYQLRIENTLGQQVFQTNITQQSDYLPLSTWGGNGLYFVRIIDPQGNTTELRKIILE